MKINLFPWAVTVAIFVGLVILGVTNRASGSSLDNPFMTSDGVRMPMTVTQADGQSFLQQCEADGIVEVRDGTAKQIVTGPPGFALTDGEPVFQSDGKRFRDSTLVALPVYRGQEGMLIFGWRHCEEMVPSDEG